MWAWIFWDYVVINNLTGNNSWVNKSNKNNQSSDNSPNTTWGVGSRPQETEEPIGGKAVVLSGPLM